MVSPGNALRTARQGWSFATGLRAFLGQRPTLADAEAVFADEIARRGERFVGSLDRNVWAVPESPYRPLLRHLDMDREAVADLVRTKGVEGALEVLRDEGLYISYEEYLGDTPITRGSLSLSVDPTSFHNTTVTADYLGSTGGTRSGGTAVAISFQEKRVGAHRALITRSAIGQDESTPVAVWFPCLPSAAGLGAVLQYAGSGSPPERWFSQIPTTMDGIPAAKRITNTMLPWFGRMAGVRLPRVEHTPSSSPEPVLDWCIDALRRGQGARLGTYPSSAVALARSAAERDVDLTGLLIGLAGEPATVDRRLAIEASGARTIALYAFMQAGGVAYSCPDETSEEYHVYDGKVAVIQRTRTRSDGVPVGAFLWTTFSPSARGVFINVENDDYGELPTDLEACSCLYGRLGCRTAGRGRAGHEQGRRRRRHRAR